MSYARPFPTRRHGVGGVPAGLVSAGAAAAKNAAREADRPEVELAVGVLDAALRGDSAAFQAAVNAGIATVAAVGATAACAATGFGVALAPVCGYIGGTVAGQVSKLLFGADGPSCFQALVRVREASFAAMSPECKGDQACEAELYAASQRYGERVLGSCTLTDNWSMAPLVRAEATRLGIALGKGENGIFGFGSGTWELHAKDRYASEAGAALLRAKMRRWDRQAAAAKAVADAEYDTLRSACPRVGIRIPGSTTPCEKKAAATASLIAAQSYLFSIANGAKPIADSQNAALRNQFFAEVAQDKTLAALLASKTATDAEKAQAARDVQANALRSASAAQESSAVLGVALLAVAALGGFYLYSQKRA